MNMQVHYGVHNVKMDKIMLVTSLCWMDIIITIENRHSLLLIDSNNDLILTACCYLSCIASHQTNIEPFF